MAIAEATQGWSKAESIEQEGIIFCFYSNADAGEEIARLLAVGFPHVLIAGCSTAGEWIHHQHQHHSLVMMYLVSSKVHWSVDVVTGLSTRSDEYLEKSIQKAVGIFNLGINCQSGVFAHQACLTLIDGLSFQEEHFVSLLSNYLLDIPMLGGSSGDNLRFQQTSLLCQTHDEPCRALNDCAVLICLDSDMPLQIIKHEHFEICDDELVITSATPEKRQVHRLNGMPAAMAYAHQVGCEVGDLSSSVFSHHPLMYRYRGENLIRSIQKAESDGSLSFYCQVEEGVILNIATAQPMLESFQEVIDEIQEKNSKPKVALVFNCILRALEADENNEFDDILQCLSAVVPEILGFDTYGEQWYGKHL